MQRCDWRVERGTELDVAGAYNAVFTSMKRTGARTSLIVDPPNGRMPPLTPEAAGRRRSRISFALLQATDTCKNKSACGGWKYDPTPSPRLAELPPRYNTRRPSDGPGYLHRSDRCLDHGAARIRRRDRQLPPASRRWRYRDLLRIVGQGGARADRRGTTAPTCPRASASGMVTPVAIGGQYAVIDVDHF